MSEQKTENTPRRLWNSALRAVKGDSTQSLVEEFTSEMTLVAEGLAEDHEKIRSQVESLSREMDRGRQELRSELESLETTIDENRRDTDEKLTALSRRLNALEAREKSSGKKQKFSHGFMTQLIILAAIAGGSWVLVTLLGLFK